MITEGSTRLLRNLAWGLWVCSSFYSELLVCCRLYCYCPLPRWKSPCLMIVLLPVHMYACVYACMHVMITRTYTHIHMCTYTRAHMMWADVRNILDLLINFFCATYYWLVEHCNGLFKIENWLFWTSVAESSEHCTFFLDDSKPPHTIACMCASVEQKSSQHFLKISFFTGCESNLRELQFLCIQTSLSFLLREHTCHM